MNFKTIISISLSYACTQSSTIGHHMSGKQTDLAECFRKPQMDALLEYPDTPDKSTPFCFYSKDEKVKFGLTKNTVVKNNGFQIFTEAVDMNIFLELLSNNKPTTYYIRNLRNNAASQETIEKAEKGICTFTAETSYLAEKAICTFIAGSSYFSPVAMIGFYKIQEVLDSIDIKNSQPMKDKVTNCFLFLSLIRHFSDLIHFDNNERMLNNIEAIKLMDLRPADEPDLPRYFYTFLLDTIDDKFATMVLSSEHRTYFEELYIESVNIEYAFEYSLGATLGIDNKYLISKSQEAQTKLTRFLGGLYKFDNLEGLVEHLSTLTKEQIRKNYSMCFRSGDLVSILEKLCAGKSKYENLLQIQKEFSYEEPKASKPSHDLPEDNNRDFEGGVQCRQQ
jgi:hypothetical protein